MTAQPWLIGVDGSEVLPLIEVDARTVRVEAPPGAGKTFGLARRVVRVLHPDGLGATPGSILVVAFNRVIAEALAADISAELGRAGIQEELRIQTVHAFCESVVRDDDTRILLPHERDAMLFDVRFSNPQVRSLYGSKAATEKALADHEAGFADHSALSNNCRSWLTQHAGRLIGDTPIGLLRRMEAGEFSDVRFKHVVVDEFQDLTTVEQQLVARVTADDGCLVALGDRRQSIYSFRGNDPNGLASLEDLTQTAVTDVQMPTCRRCPPEVVQTANQLMAGDGSAEILSASKIFADLHVVHYKTSAAETKGIAAAVADSVRTYGIGHKHLVIVPRRKFGFDLRDALVSLDPQMHIDLSFTESVLELWPVREAFLLLSLLGDPDPLTWRSWFAHRTPTSPIQTAVATERNADAYLQFLASHRDRIDDDAVRSLAAQPRTASRGNGGLVIWDRADRYVELADGIDLEQSAENLVDEILDPQRWLTDEMPNAAIALHDLEALHAEAVQVLASLDPARDESPITSVVRELRHRIATREPLGNSDTPEVKITTYWGSKGLTADSVFVTGVFDAAIPGTRPSTFHGTDLDHIEEQRRLFFVALTRTKRTLVLSRPARIKYGEAKRLGLHVKQTSSTWVNLPSSQFLRAVQSVLPHSVPGEEWSGTGQ